MCFFFALVIRDLSQQNVYKVVLANLPTVLALTRSGYCSLFRVYEDHVVISDEALMVSAHEMLPFSLVLRGGGVTAEAVNPFSLTP